MRSPVRDEIEGNSGEGGGKTPVTPRLVQKVLWSMTSNGLKLESRTISTTKKLRSASARPSSYLTV